MYVRAFVDPRPVYLRMSFTTAPEIAETVAPFGLVGDPDKEAPFAPPSYYSGRAKEREATEWSPSARPAFPLRAA